MNSDKAIELNIESVKSLTKGKFLDHADAVMIGNEAIKYRQTLKEEGLLDSDDLLPGED